MLRIGFRLACVVAWLLIDAMVAWWLASAAVSFVMMNWIAATGAPMGRALWLALFLYMARNSIGEAIVFADRHLTRTSAS